jgi:hypothetical protein
MLSSLLRPSRGSQRRNVDHSPFSSPSPGIARRAAPNERSQLLPRSGNARTGYREEIDGDNDNEGDEGNATEDDDLLADEDEDGVEDATPLLPIFSAAHLGLEIPCPFLFDRTVANILSRCFTNLQSHSCDPSSCRF